MWHGCEEELLTIIYQYFSNKLFLKTLTNKAMTLKLLIVYVTSFFMIVTKDFLFRTFVGHKKCVRHIVLWQNFRAIFGTKWTNIMMILFSFTNFQTNWLLQKQIRWLFLSLILAQFKLFSVSLIPTKKKVLLIDLRIKTWLTNCITSKHC